MLKRLLLAAMFVCLLGVGGLARAQGTSEPAVGQGAVSVEVSGLDLSIIFVYLVGIVALGCWAGVRRKESKGSDYFLAGKSLSWPMIGLALFATNISTIHLVSFAQNGYTSGLTYGNFEWMAAFTLVILSLFFAPFYLRSKVATLPDFMEKRFSRGSRDYLAVLSIFSAVVVHIGFSLYTGAIVLEGTVLQSLGVENPEHYRLLTIIGMVGVTAIYTIVGGLLAVVLTESVQTVVLLVGSLCITLIGYQMLGGWADLKANVHPVNLTVLRGANEPTGITWYAVLLGYPVLGVWYWCTDQTIVQRVLGAKDENHARVGPLFAGFIKILPVFLFVLPGLICLGLINKGVEAGGIAPLPTRPDGSPMTEQTYIHLIKTLLWPGMQGVVIAAMLAALMSTVSGALNSIATLCSYDIYQRFKPSADDRHLIRVGRIATFMAMCVAVAWSMAISALGETIFQAMVDVLPIVAPPTAVVFLFGVFWRRTSSRAALWTLVGGSMLGLAIYVLKTLDTLEAIKLAELNVHVAGFVKMNGLFMAFILFVVQSAFILLVSLAWPHRHTAQSEALVWRSPLDALRGENIWRGPLDFRVMAVLLVLVMVGLYWTFSSSTSYYPVAGTVTVDGRPATGVRVILKNDDPTLCAELSTGVDGKFQFATTARAGGAPAGTKYRVRLVPERDFLVRLDPDDPEKVAEVLDSAPAGTPIEERTEDGRRFFVLGTSPEPKRVTVARGAIVQIWSAPSIPGDYQAFDTSNIELVVEAKDEPNRLDIVIGPAE